MGVTIVLSVTGAILISTWFYARNEYNKVVDWNALNKDTLSAEKGEE